MRPCWSYPYVSHLVQVRPEVAEFHFDLAYLRLVAEAPRSVTGRPVVAVPSGRLVLGGVRSVGERRGYRPARAVAATLHPGRWGAGPIAVDVELLPWSATRSELALIAGRTRRRGPVAERRYLRLAHDVLDVLVDALLAAGDDDRQLAGLADAGHPSLKLSVDGVVLRQRNVPGWETRPAP